MATGAEQDSDVLSSAEAYDSKDSGRLRENIRQVLEMIGEDAKLGFPYQKNPMH